jgi:hypothetical protein
MKPGWPYAVLTGVAILLTVGGALSLLGHLAGQIRQGHASDLSLVAGGACFAAGIILLVLADLGTRLVRIEMKLGTLPEDLPGNESRRAVDRDRKLPGEPGAA